MKNFNYSKLKLMFLIKMSSLLERNVLKNTKNQTNISISGTSVLVKAFHFLEKQIEIVWLM